MSRILQPLVVGLVLVTASLSSEQAEAQRFGVSIGNGAGVRIGVGNGPMYGPGPYGAAPGYRNYGYGPVGVGVPARPASPGPTPLIASQQPSLSMSPTPMMVDGGEIVLFNPSSTGQDVRYLLNGQLFTMPSGTKQSIVNDRTWTIQYEASPGTISTYTLVSARYKFKQTETGVGLFQTQDTPEAAQAASGLPPAPTPNPPESSLLQGPIPQPPIPDLDGTVIPSRPALKTTP